MLANNDSTATISVRCGKRMTGGGSIFTPIGGVSTRVTHGFELHKALKYGKVAGDRALSMRAPRAAVEHFTRASDSAEKLGERAAADVLRGRGQAYHDLGEFPLARADYENALATATSERQLAWHLLLDLNLLWSGRDYSVAGEYAERALAAARDMDDPGCIARSLDRVGNWHMNVGNVPDALAHQRQALQAFWNRWVTGVESPTPSTCLA